MKPTGRRQPLLEPRKQPVQSRSKVTYDHLLTAAAQVFGERGYAGATTNRIAERGGFSVGTLYQYFPSKEAVAVALLELHIDETRRKLHEWIGHVVASRHPLRAALLDYVIGIMQVHGSRPRLQHILLEETRLPERLHRVLLEAEDSAVQAVAHLLRLYPEIGRSAERSAYLVVHTVEALTHHHAAHRRELSLSDEELAAELVIMLEAYLTCRSPPAAAGGPRGGRRRRRLHGRGEALAF